MKLIKNDEEQLNKTISEHLKATLQIEKREQKELIDLSEEKRIEDFIGKVKSNLKDCLIKRCLIVSSKSHLITLTYLFDAIKLLNDYPKIDGFAL